ncbi:molybdenum cofactor guanylyltransferase [Pararobbsia silviterrae]|uniref:Molybdenum cofactor guanylyltransferase n=1 Tax=Pararobbsia silviterrae TaxID=1792498 RepID=A0A494Y991_9BURK|nr:molybdenum cofactor guanylyltransferase [Pararobbsia silviterrae]RKP56470.1 molybdenum cofactor guanylyltransferase [Pararobbsia silviterrae]
MTHGTRTVIARAQLTGLILAGGQGARMGGVDKGLEPLLGRPLVEHAIARLAPQVGHLAISANRHIAEYRRYGYPVFSDDAGPMRTASPQTHTDANAPDATHAGTPRFSGPLAGIATGLASIDSDWLLVVPCDAPLFPTDLAARLIEAIEISAADLAVAATIEADGSRQRHPVFALIPRRLAASAAAALDAGAYKLDAWYRRHNPVEVSFPDSRAFYNANTLRDLRELER